MAGDAKLDCPKRTYQAERRIKSEEADVKS